MGYSRRIGSEHRLIATLASFVPCDPPPFEEHEGNCDKADHGCKAEYWDVTDPVDSLPNRSPPKRAHEKGER